MMMIYRSDKTGSLYFKDTDVHIAYMPRYRQFHYSKAWFVYAKSPSNQQRRVRGFDKLEDALAFAARIVSGELTVDFKMPRNVRENA